MNMPEAEIGFHHKPDRLYDTAINRWITDTFYTFYSTVTFHSNSLFS